MLYFSCRCSSHAQEMYINSLNFKKWLPFQLPEIHKSLKKKDLKISRFFFSLLPSIQIIVFLYSCSVRVNPRASSLKQEVYGLVKRAEVVRGPHWNSGDEDGKDDCSSF